MATTIEVSDETWNRLNSQKERGQSFDDVIQNLLGKEVPADAD